MQEWELILLDDGSKDVSLLIAKSVKDPRITVYSDGVNKGIGQRRAEIVDLAQAEYLAWQDGDDLMHPDRLQVQYDYLISNPDVELVETSYYCIDANTNVVGLYRKRKGVKAISPRCDGARTNGNQCYDSCQDTHI